MNTISNIVDTDLSIGHPKDSPPPGYGTNTLCGVGYYCDIHNLCGVGYKRSPVVPQKILEGWKHKTGFYSVTPLIN